MAARRDFLSLMSPSESPEREEVESPRLGSHQPSWWMPFGGLEGRQQQQRQPQWAPNRNETTSVCPLLLVSPNWAGRGEAAAPSSSGESKLLACCSATATSTLCAFGFAQDAGEGRRPEQQARLAASPAPNPVACRCDELALDSRTFFKRTRRRLCSHSAPAKCTAQSVEQHEPSKVWFSFGQSGSPSQPEKQSSRHNESRQTRDEQLEETSELLPIRSASLG